MAVSRRRDSDTESPDMFAGYQPRPVVERFSAERVRASSCAARIKQALKETLRECGRSREQVAAEISEYLGEVVSPLMLDQYTSGANEKSNIPAHRLKTDNGSDFIAHTTRRLFAALGIEHELAPPFQPEKKGHVERAIGTLQHGLMRTLDGFIGHSVADRKVIENRRGFAKRLGKSDEDVFEVKLTAADLQVRLDAWCNDVYANKPHAGLKGQTPFAIAAASGTTIRRIDDVHALDMLLAPVAGKNGLRVVTKNGVRTNDTYYSAGWLGLEVGRTVLVRMDEADMGRAYLFDQDGETYLGEAISPDLLGIDPSAAARAVRAEQKRLIDESMAEADKLRRTVKAIDLAGAIHRQALKDAGTLIEFPKKSEGHDTPALAAARSAVQPAVTEHSAEVAAFAEQLRAAEATSPAPTVRKLRTEETAHQRWNRAREIEAKLARGEFVEPADAVWLGGYREGPEYRGFKLTYDDAYPAGGESGAGQN